MLVQKLSAKVSSVETVKDISACFNNSILNITKAFDEAIVVYDTYRDNSLKNRTKGKRRNCAVLGPRGDKHSDYLTQ